MIQQFWPCDHWKTEARIKNNTQPFTNASEKISLKTNALKNKLETSAAHSHNIQRRDEFLYRNHILYFKNEFVPTETSPKLNIFEIKYNRILNFFLKLLDNSEIIIKNMKNKAFYAEILLLTIPRTFSKKVEKK
jgi:hypothetical protein